MLRTISFLIIALTLMAIPRASAQMMENSSLLFHKDSLAIQSTDKTTHTFTVELATNYPQWAQGLMFRKDLPKDAGMLFLFGEEKIASIWMKNTYIPLDIIFIRKDGTIARIEADAVPESLRSMSSGELVSAVLELNAGTSHTLNIKPEDRVIYKTFTTAGEKN